MHGPNATYLKFTGQAEQRYGHLSPGKLTREPGFTTTPLMINDHAGSAAIHMNHVRTYR